MIDIFEFVQDGRFSVLARAMEESAFFNKLRAAGSAPITILAPSDEAFQKIPSSRLEAILKDKEARLGRYSLKLYFHSSHLDYVKIWYVKEKIKQKLSHNFGTLMNPGRLFENTKGPYNNKKKINFDISWQY